MFLIMINWKYQDAGGIPARKYGRYFIMEQQIFTNESILSWLQYFAKNTAIDLEKVKMLDITRKNKNLIPTVESHRAVLVFTEAGIADIFYRMWNA